MGFFNGVFPVLPGQEDAARVLSKELSGPRAEAFNESQARCGITEETWALQQTPAGTFWLVFFKGDVEKAFTNLATSEEDYEKWFRAQILEICGVDLAQPPAGPPPENIFEWKA